MQNRLGNLLVVAVIAFAIVLAGCGSSGTVAQPAKSAPPASAPSSSASLAPFKVGVAPLIFNSILYLGKEKGFFKEAGIELELKPAGSGAEAIAQLLNGEIQGASMAAQPPIMAAAKGMPVRLLTGMTSMAKTADTDTVGIVTKNQAIRSSKDLEGKTLAVNALGQQLELTARVVVEQAGGDPSKVKFIEVPFQDAVAALEGRVDAAAVVEPFYATAVDKGARVIANPSSQSDPGGTETAFVVSNDYVLKNGETVQKFATAMRRAVAFAAENPNEVRAIAKTYTRIDPAALATMKLPTFSANIDKTSLQKQASWMVKYGFIEKTPDIDALVVK